MSWLEDIQSNRKRQVEQMAKAFGYNEMNLRKAEDDGVDYSTDETEEETSGASKKKKSDGKSNVYKMKMLGLRKFNEQDHKDYVGVEDVDNSYITNLDNGDIVISKTEDGYLVSKFPIDIENREGEETETNDLSSAIDIALSYKEDLEVEENPEQIMYKETEKSFEDEINPFDKVAWEANLSKAELDEFEKAKHADGDMHPNGKWVWHSSANGGKGDWRVVSPSKRGGGKTTASTTKKQEPTTVAKKTTTSDGVAGRLKSSVSIDVFRDVKKTSEYQNLEEYFKNPDAYTDKQGAGIEKDFNERVEDFCDSLGQARNIAYEIKNALTDEIHESKQSTISDEKDKKKLPSDAKKIMDALKTNNSKYSDSSKVTVEATPKGNWRLYYDGKDTGVTIKGSVLSEDTIRDLNWEHHDVDNKKEKDTKKVVHDINGTKVAVTKNTDGSYTLEANGKKVKTDDPSYFVNGTNLKLSVKRALAKEAGI